MRVMIAIPCHDKTDVAFETSLIYLRKDQDDGMQRVVSSLIYDARNQLLLKAHQLGADYILWLDSDMVFTPDLLDRMMEAIGDKDFLSGLYFRRKPPFTPCIFSRIDYEKKEDEIIPISVTQRVYPKGEQFEIEGCGFGAVLMKTAMGMDIWEKRGMPFSPVLGFGEDLSFCYKARELGYKLYCDASIQLGHISQVVIDESHYLAYQKKLSESV